LRTIFVEWKIMINVQKVVIEMDNTIQYKLSEGIENVLTYLCRPKSRNLFQACNINNGEIIIGFDEKLLLRDIEINVPDKDFDEGQIIEMEIQDKKINLLLDTSIVFKRHLHIPVFYFRQGMIFMILFLHPGSKGNWYGLSDTVAINIYRNKIAGILYKK
jgi:hypothetical protein